MSRAKNFVFFSFAGGAGVSTISFHAAKALRARTNKSVLFLEFNLNRPSLFHALYSRKPPELTIVNQVICASVPVYKNAECLKQFSEHGGVKLLSFMERSQVIDYDQIVFEAYQLDDRYKIRALFQFLESHFDFIVVDLPPVFSFFQLDIIKSADHFFYIHRPPLASPRMDQGFKQMKSILLDRGFPETHFRLIANERDENSESGVDKVEAFFSFPSLPSLPPVHEDRDPPNRAPFHELAGLLMALPHRERVSGNEDRLATERIREQKVISYKKDIQQKIIHSIDKRITLSDRELKRQVLNQTELLFKDFPPPLTVAAEIQELKKDIINEITGLGPLEDLLEDPEIDEIMVNGFEKIYVEKGGRIVKTNKNFSSNDQVKAIIDRILMPIGRQINEMTPYVDGRLQDGSRIHAIIPPLSLTGPMLTIRKFAKNPIGVKDLISKFHTFSPSIAEFLKLCVLMKKNILVSGGAGSGKTTLLNIISEFIPEGERIITIEDSAELRINRDHVGRLEARAASSESTRAKVSIRDLVINALRMRPDRIIVGECRGGEAIDMLQAMNTGHQGSLTTIHANTPGDTISRLETMVLMAGVELPLKAVRNQISSAIDIVVQMARFGDGSRRVQAISEIVGIKDEDVEIRDIFHFEQKWVDTNGHIYGEFSPTGHIPKFLSQIKSQNLDISLSIFDNSKSAKEVNP